jgi:hypothetical protein
VGPTSHVTQWPMPSQTVPPSSVQAVPVGAFATLHVLITQPVMTQVVLDAGQSSAELHWTHWPDPSQTVPPLSSHATPSGASVSTHASFGQLTEMHVVPGSGQPVAAQEMPLLLLVIGPAPPAVAALPLFVVAAPPGPLAPAPEELVVSRTTLPPQAAATDETTTRKSGRGWRMAAA